MKTRITLAVLLLSTAAAAQRPLATVAPTPESVLGFKPGTDRKLADYSQITEFFRKLDAASDCVQVFTIGKTTEGRDMVLAAISSAENLRNLPRYREIARRLADPRGLREEEARALAREGKTIAWVDFGLHATEVAHAQLAPEMAWTLAVSDNDEARRIRDNVIVVTVPVMNPDGLDIVTRWYRSNVGTPFETSPLPELYQKYAGHDNNRDWFMLNLAESRVITRQLYGEWNPQLLYNHHQSGITSPRIWAPPMDDPVNPNIHPLVNRGISLLGVGIMQRLEQEGKPGAQGYSTYSNWWNGGMRSTPCFHNIVGILTETASGRYASPVEISPSQLPKTLASGESALEPSIWNPNPWRGGTWRLRNQMDYMATATMAFLRLAADFREDWLYNRYQMARDQIEAGGKGDPFAFVIPREQHDWPTAVRLAETLARGAVEIHMAPAAFSTGGKTYSAGSLVVWMAQPHRGYAKDLLEPQRHPDRRQGPGGPPKPPYDIAGWTLSYQMGVTADRIRDPFNTPVERITDFSSLLVRDATQPAAGALVLDRRINNAVVAAMRLLKRGVPVGLTRESFVVDGETRGARELLSSLGLVAGPAPQAPPRILRLPRVGIYRSHVASMDEGWTRYVLDQFEIPFESVDSNGVRSGLEQKYDCLILPKQPARDILNGHAPGTMPERYVGGIGKEGVAALRSFVESGGTLIALDAACAVPIQNFGLPVRDILEQVRSTEFYCPGSLLRVEADASHPLTGGLPSAHAVFFINSRAFEIAPADAEASRRPRILARYAERDLLMSGWINGEALIAGKAAAVEVPLGRGRVVLIGFGGQFRGQPHGTFKYLFNPILESAAGR